MNPYNTEAGSLARWRAACVALAFAMVFVPSVLATPPAQAQTYKEKVLYRFTGTGGDGDSPDAGLVGDAAGNLYGTTSGGGLAGWGTVFKLDPTGKETLLYSFTGGTDGGDPEAGLVRDANGNFYGATLSGGDSRCNAAHGCGVVFKLTPNMDGSWTEKVLHRFTGGADGEYPSAGLTLDKAGSLYGTTSQGGVNRCYLTPSPALHRRDA
jgi:uncharacterized repeat protein (TIGR03803 family)